MADARIRSHSPHDAKTDLSIINAALQLAARRLADDPELHAALRNAIDRAHRLARAVDDGGLADSAVPPERLPP